MYISVSQVCVSLSPFAAHVDNPASIALFSTFSTLRTLQTPGQYGVMLESWNFLRPIRFQTWDTRSGPPLDYGTPKGEGEKSGACIY